MESSRPVVRRLAQFGITVLALTVPAAIPAEAAVCELGYAYTVTGTTVRIPFKGMPVFRNGPGGTMTVSKQYDKQASYQVVVGAESEVGAVLAKAKVSISAGLTKTNSTSVINSHTWKVSAGKYGNARYDAIGKKVSYKKYREYQNCSRVLLTTGVISFPDESEGWKYWETSS